MECRQARSFTEISILNAVARRLRVDLVMEPVTPGSDTRLLSRFLQMQDPQSVILSVPQSRKGDKVFVPIGWRLGVAFELGNLWLQAATVVLGHCFLPPSAGRHAEGLVVKRPDSFLSCNRRNAPRHRVDPVNYIAATLWEGQEADRPHSASVSEGQVSDWSEGGLGLRLTSPLELEVGTAVMVCLQKGRQDERLILRGVLRHCTSLGDGAWQAGLGNIREVTPGEAHRLIEFLATADSDDDGPCGGF